MAAKTYDFDDVVMFGKHRGKSITRIIADDPGYIIWALANVKGFFATEAVLKEARANS